MADTAAFFAQKKLKKKKFKAFNANKIDASAVVSTTQAHVDAPEISLDDVTTSLGGLSSLGLGVGGESGVGGALSSGDDQWADTQGGGWGSKKKGGAAANSTSTAAVVAGSGADSKVAELLDMQALNAKRNVQDDVAERLRIEETKAALARAKEGMAKEAERLAAEKAEKEAKAAARAEARAESIGGATSALGGSGAGGKWVPSFRSTASSSGTGSSIRGPVSMGGVGSGFQKSVDMSNEELFPDLAAADQILTEREKQLKAEQDRMASSSQSSVRAPDGWGSRMMTGSSASALASSPQRKPLVLSKPSTERKPLNLAPPSKKKEEDVEPAAAAEAVAKEEEKVVVETEPAVPESVVEGTTTAKSTEPTAESTTSVAEAAPAATTTSAPEKSTAPAPVLKKKKKKDLSTFKAKS
ncbi:hypothetical protein ACHAWU_009935 [Discostella pseudostelligera]|uniref:Uncharacterized protein n=1 Tax=Discostella pseudostelligera TaxID=259834 RepID=A0ABD3LXU2_9STRA